MIRRQELGKVVTLVSCALFLTTAAQADGQPRGRAASPAAAPAAPSSWSGLYVGANAGYAWGGDDGASIAGNDPVFQSMFNGTAFPGGTSFARSRALDRDGLTGGVQVGYNWQVGSAWVVGVETDFNWADFEGRGATIGIIDAGPPVVAGTVRGIQDVDWYGTLRARVGVLAANHVMLYATGGLAYGRIREAATFSADVVGGGSAGGFSIQCPVANIPCAVGRSSDTQFGWTVGAGGEFLLSSNITVRAEYLYVDLGDGGAVTAIATTPTPGLAAASFKTTFNDVDFHTVRLGINFKLGSDCCATARK